MRYSDNYNLKLPQRGVDRANVDDLDGNFEIIDGALADDRQISLPMYDSTQSYNTGDIRGYENPTTHRIRAYRCLEDNVTGLWDATKWAQTTLADEIGTGGGASSLEDLTDTDITSPTNGQTLKYNSTSGKWENASGGAVSDLDDLGDVDITTPSDGDLLTYDAQNDEWVNAPASVPDLGDLGDVTLTTPSDGQALTFDNGEWVNKDLPAVTKTATGNPIEISDGANAPLVKCVTEIQGYQEGTGTPSPDNIRPIVAYTELKILVRGKNLFDKDAKDTSNGYIANAYIRSNNSIQSDSDRYVSEYIEVEGNIDYIIENVSGNNVGYCFYDEEKNYISGGSYGIQWGVYGNATFTTPSNAKYVRVSVIIAKEDVTQLEKGSTATAYEPYKGTDYTIDLNGTRYGGTLDVVRGVLTVTKKEVVFDGSNDENWNVNASIASWFYIDNAFDNAYGDNAKADFQIANLGVQKTYSGVTSLLSGEFAFSSALNRFVFKNTSYTSVADWKTYLASNNLQVVYELATPIEVSLTPTAIRSLLGYSHIESSTGDMEIEYITGKYQPLVDLIESSKHVYSTAEQVVGTWVDGSIVYEKTISFTPPSNNYVTVSTAITGFDKCVGYSGIVMLGSGIFEDINYNRPDSSNSTYYTAITADGDIFFKTYEATTGTVYITMQYTKTASNRSLSKGTTETEKTSLEPISEPLTDKTDSLSKDEAELKEEDESKEIEEITDIPEEEPEEPIEVTEEEPTEEPIDPEPSKEEEADER